MQKRFGQVKRYSLEGSEGMMAVMQVLLELHQNNADEVIVAMPHRGRLNLLTDLLGYPVDLLFSKLKGNPELPLADGFTGDVISHLFQRKLYDQPTNITGKGTEKNMMVTLLPNPSHLEAINPVALGYARGMAENRKVSSIQLHGDAAFSGQGIVFESLQLSNLPGEQPIYFQGLLLMEQFTWWLITSLGLPQIL